MLTLVMCWYANAGIEVNVQNEVYNCRQMLPYNINLEDRKNPTKFPGFWDDCIHKQFMQCQIYFLTMSDKKKILTRWSRAPQITL